MKYEDIAKEMLKDIRNDNNLTQKYKLDQFTSIDLYCDNDLIKFLYIISKIKDEPNHSDEESTNTSRVSNLLNKIVNV